MLKVGELAALANLTVRTLHHYDDIGLLRPSARSDAGYRLYSRDDVARLHRIQALRSFGMCLADIGLALDSPEGDALAVVDRQLAELEERILDAGRLRAQLLRLRGQLAGGAMPDLSTWLTTVEMTMESMESILNVYEKYFTQDELARLPLYRDTAVQARWPVLVEQASGLMQSNVAPDAEAAQVLARRWLDVFDQSTGGDAELQARINAMALREQEAVGLPAPLMEYVLAAIGALKRGVWAKYLQPGTIERMERHQAMRGHEWPALIEQVHAQALADPDGTAPRSRELGQAWMALFHDMVGADPREVDAFRRATATEPLLRMGPGIDDGMLAWLRRAIQSEK